MIAVARIWDSISMRTCHCYIVLIPWDCVSSSRLAVCKHSELKTAISIQGPWSGGSTVVNV